MESKPSKKVSKKSRMLGTSRSGKRSQKKKKKSSLSPPPQVTPRIPDNDFVKSVVDPDPRLPQDEVPSHLIESALANEPTPNQFEGIVIF